MDDRERAPATIARLSIERDAYLRQRDEAIGERNELRYQLDIAIGERNELRRQLDVSIRERSELRRQLDLAIGERSEVRRRLDEAVNGILVNSLVGQAALERERAKDEASQLRLRCSRLTAQVAELQQKKS